METKKCPGYEKDCSEVIGVRAEMCAKCYARKWYAQKHPKKKAASVKPARELKVNAPRKSGEDVMKEHGFSGHGSIAVLKADLQQKLAAVEAVEAMLGRMGI